MTMIHIEWILPHKARRIYGKRLCFRVDDVFDDYYESEFDEVADWAPRIVREIDKSELISPLTVKSPVFDIIPYTWLSTGAKHLILISSPLDYVYHLDFMGENCFGLLFEIARTKEVYACISSLLRFVSTGLPDPVEFMGKIYSDPQSLIAASLEESDNGYETGIEEIQPFGRS